MSCVLLLTFTRCACLLVLSLPLLIFFLLFFFFNDTATTEIYPLSLHDALPIYGRFEPKPLELAREPSTRFGEYRSEEHTSELQSLRHLVCRLLLEKKK